MLQSHGFLFSTKLAHTLQLNLHNQQVGEQSRVYAPARPSRKLSCTHMHQFATQVAQFPSPPSSWGANPQRLGITALAYSVNSVIISCVNECDEWMRMNMMNEFLVQCVNSLCSLIQHNAKENTTKCNSMV